MIRPTVIARISPASVKTWTILSCLLLTQPLAAEVGNPIQHLDNPSPSINNSAPPGQNSDPVSRTFFEVNRGQLHEKIRFKAHNASQSLFLTATEAVYVLRSARSQDQRFAKASTNATALYMTLIDADPNSMFEGLEENITKLNYFRGNIESKWQSNVPTYNKLQMSNIYHGIDIVWFGKNNGEVQYDFVIKPYADPGQIEWLVEGAEDVSVNVNGDLEIVTENGTLRQEKPFSYQQNDKSLNHIASSFSVRETSEVRTKSGKSFRVRFELDEYDRSKTLTIDPNIDLGNLDISTFLGGFDGDEFAYDVKVSADGNVYVIGLTASTDFPTTPGSFDPTTDEFLNDLFVTKLNPTMSQLVYSTFIGGSDVEAPAGQADLEIDVDGNVYFISSTRSSDYPTTPLAFDGGHNGASDIVVSKLNPSGSALVFSTFIGGSGEDFGEGIAIDPDGNLVIAGRAGNGIVGYPVLPNSFDISHNGSFDGVISRLSPDGSQLIQSTFIGSNGHDFLTDVTVDSAGFIYITGAVPANSTNYPTTPGAFDTTRNDGPDAFLTKFNQTLSQLEYSTFFGGDSDDQSLAVAVDADGNAYICGSTSSDDFPITAGAISPTRNGTRLDGFVAKFDPLGENLIYSTYLGSDEHDLTRDIKVDQNGLAYVLTDIRSFGQNFPTTPNAFRGLPIGGADVAVSVLNPTGTFLEYSTYIGGTGTEFPHALFVDPIGKVYFTGSTQNHTDDYPTTPGVFGPSINNNINTRAFISKFGSVPNPIFGDGFEAEPEGP